MKIKHGAFALFVALFAIAGAGVAHAAPASAKNPNVVAYYESGDHGIPGDYNLHTGIDVVQKSGASGNFIQWFMGWAAETDGNIGHHSVWKISKNGDCKKGEVFVPNASASWGDYLVEGADYCVLTTDFAY